MTQRILLIQDDATAAKAILNALNGSGDGLFEVEWVRCCTEGLERLAGSAAILVDLSLPDSRGIDTFDRLFNVAHEVPILILCTPHEEGTAKLAVQCGAQDYIFKDLLEAYPLRKAVESMIERAANVEALFEEKERAQVTLNSIGDAVVSTDVSGHVTFLNTIAEGLTGWANDDALGRTLEEVFQIVDATTRETTPNPLMLAIATNKHVALAPNCVLIRRDGVETAIEDTTAPIHNRRGQVTGAVMVFHDVSEARAMALKMSYLAQHDSLTDLPNRILLNDRLSEAIALSARYGRKLAVLFLDLDRFKNINDSLGHIIGDGLLQSVGCRLYTCVRSSDTVSRLGGDEFVVLLWEVNHAQDAAITADKMLHALREPHAIERCELSLHYQPKMNLATGTIIGVEALIRWCHPERGLVPPVQFIAIAEDSGLIVPIGRWVLREACRQARAWQVAGLPPMCMAINISAVELRTPGFVAGVRTILKETSLEPRYLELELTETALLEDSRSVADVLKELKDIGVLLALDDFGTGYSSLSHLKRFPIDALKIDKSFVHDLTTAEDDAGIVTAVIGLGRTLHMGVVAEGVETREQLAILQEYGCPQGQGYYFSRPVPAVKFGHLLKHGAQAIEFA